MTRKTPKSVPFGKLAVFGGLALWIIAKLAPDSPPTHTRSDAPPKPSLNKTEDRIASEPPPVIAPVPTADWSTTPHGVNGGEQHWIVKTSQPDQPPAITISRPSGFGDGKSAWLVLRCIESEASVLIAAPLPMSGSGPISVSYRLSNGIQKTEEWISTSNGVFFAPSGDSSEALLAEMERSSSFAFQPLNQNAVAFDLDGLGGLLPSFWAECAKVPNRATEEYSDPDSATERREWSQTNIREYQHARWRPPSPAASN